MDFKNKEWIIYDAPEEISDDVRDLKHNQRLMIWWEGWNKTPRFSYADIKIILATKDWSRICDTEDWISLSPAYDCMRQWIKEMDERYKCNS